MTDEARDTTCNTHLTAPLPVKPRQEEEGTRDFTESHLRGCLTARKAARLCRAGARRASFLSLALGRELGLFSKAFSLGGRSPPHPFSSAEQRGRAPNRELSRTPFVAQLYSTDYSPPVKGATTWNVFAAMKIMAVTCHVLFTTPKAQQLQVARLGDR